MKKRCSNHRWVVEREAPIRRWIVLGVLLALPTTLSFSEPPRRSSVSPAREPRGGESPSGIVDCSGPNNPLQNCGFETGDFIGWGTEDLQSPFVPLTVDVADLTPLCFDVDPPVACGFFFSSPTEGTFAALHGWDGDAGTIKIHQDVALGGVDPILEFDFRAGWNLTDFGATMDRTFVVTIEPRGGGAPLLSSLILTADAGTTILDTQDQPKLIGLRSVGGQDVRISFNWVVPESGKGPAFVQFDNVSVFSTCGNGVLDGPCNCCTGGDGFGCNHDGCDAIVCDFDPFCCGMGWDSICDAEAISMCSCCTGEDCDDGNVVDAVCCSPSCLNGDINDSGRVDGFDLAPLAQALGLNSANIGFVAKADLVADGLIDGLDLNELIDLFGCDFTPVSTP